MNNDKEIGHIESLTKDHVTIIFSSSFINIYGSSKRLFKKSSILFRGRPTPISLIAEGTQVECTIDERSYLTSVCIPSNLEITATFGKVIDINLSNGTALLNSIVGYTILLSQLLRNNIPIDLHEIERYLNWPVYILLNGDSILEASLIDSDAKFFYTLDSFKNNLRAIEEIQYVFMRDDRLIIHFLPIENAFFKDSFTNVPKNKIRCWIGREITVRFLNGKFIGEIDAELENRAFFKKMKKKYRT